MGIRIKICGITREEDAAAAVASGAHALGFILYPKSPRYVSPERAAEILATVPPYVERVAVVVNPSAEEVRRIAGIAPFSQWQLHGAESPALMAEIREAGSHPYRFVKALHLPFEGGARGLAAYATAGAGAFLLDTPCVEHGGSGKTFDWNLVEGFRMENVSNVPIILSGGLTADNVGEAVTRVRPYAVDVSSGVESAPGIKDPIKIERFISRCLTASLPA
ncbi:phosphoribosylanthranilate isomerase [Verrucomicrobium sp. GAS474]|uniref:phosphoribosylanthranilate isomerase n=1 Tax=Verrucomicrobium sp. GAS474 TaxID=1882831 RepID=UPI00087D7953|nr:phosphoribosylanthranilate isomerase [Verrucomicrobium sp. GAS474]SDU14965.1 phosphoribosylanthranilate isomerase [Verrucomicrobium sp. GAS474]